MTGVTERLFALADEGYREFNSSLIPTLDKSGFIGVRTPALRALAKELYGTGEYAEFLRELPHRYFDENQLHAFVVSLIRDYDECVAAVDEFLPYVDNWATCDQLSPKVFRKHRGELLPHICRWLASDHPYTIRFGMEMLMSHFLDEDFDSAYPRMVAAVRSEDYYVKMMAAWYFATALAKQYDAVFPYIAEYRLEKWTHNKAIQKAVESYRITPEQKEILKKYRIK